MSIAALAPTGARTLVVGASVAGPGHVRRGVPCQDHHAAEVLDDTVVLAVSDGLGSATRAAEGAETAATTAVRAGSHVVRSAPEYPPPGLAHHMLSCARARLSTVADPIEDVACTLIAVVASARAIAVAHIGDGGVVARVDGAWRIVSGAPDREYVNEVDPLTHPSWAEHVRVSTVEGSVDTIAVFTDGCAHAAIGADGSVGPGFIPMLAEHLDTLDGGALEALLTGDKLSEHSDDDKTLVFVSMGA